MEIITQNLKETQAVARALAQEILAGRPLKKALVLAFSGELGAGKTSFVQGLAKGLGIKVKVKSPSFLLMKQYKVPGKEIFLIHLDCYRLNSFEDLESLGFSDLLNDAKNIVALEWAEKVRKYLPKNNTLFLKFEHAGEKSRKIKIQ